MAGIVSIAVQLSGVPEGTINNSSSIAGNSSNEHTTTSLELASGANTITVPSWAQGAIIRPDPTNAVAMTLKGVSGDTGIALDLTGPSLINFAASPPANFVLTSAGSTSTYTSIEFF
jgi:hypothetical protein